MQTELDAHRFQRLKSAVSALVLILLLMGSPVPAGSTEPDMKCPLWNAARDAIQLMKPFRVSFIQQVYYGDDLSVEESGDLLFVESRRIRLTYRVPEKKVFLLEGDRYQFYEPEAGQLTRGRVNSSQKGWIWELLVSNDRTGIRKCNPANRSLEIEDASEEGVQYLVFLDSDHRVKRVEFRDSGGGRHVFIFSDYQPGVPVQADAFRMKTPPGTEVIIMEEESLQ